jgi:hypothetical protein
MFATLKLFSKLFILFVAIFNLRVACTKVSYDATVAGDIFANQNPPNSLCSKKRLLVMNSDPTYFEGTGSIMKSIMFGIAEAMHSNRTLIWGRFVPILFTRAKEKACYNPSQGGLFDCFFEKMSTCTLSDVTPLEIIGLGQNGYDDTARVTLQQPRRGLAAYVPPRQYRSIPDIQLIWPTQIAAYLFRLKISPPDVPGPPPMYCAHVRHGDIRTLSYVYKNKAIFEFEDYFNALAIMSVEQQPGSIFFATDSIDVISKLEEFEDSWLGRMEGVVNFDADGNVQTVDTVPNIVTTDHYRSEYGSHIAAAKGGCLSGKCAFPWQQLEKLKAERAMFSESDDVYERVLESIDDMFILSHCQKLVGSASSHMSTFSLLLVWNKQRKVNFDDFEMLDMDGIVTGQYESSYLLGTFNAQGAVAPENGYERYASLQMRFGDTEIEHNGMPDLKADPYYFNMPTMEYAVFDEQADKWRADQFTHSICRPGTDLQTLINYGVDHSTWHPNVALQCWNLAMKMIKSLPALDPLVLEVVSENILVVQEKQFAQYIRKLL